METLEDLGAFTFKKLWKNTVYKFSDRPALGLVGEEPLTYAQVNVEVERRKRDLINLGMKRGDRILLIGSGSPQWGISYLSIVLTGAVAVPLLPDFSEVEISSFCRHSGAVGIIVSEKLSSKILPEVRDMVEYVFNLENWKMEKHSSRSVENPDYEPLIEDSETASIIYTSGTTGKSKGVELTHKNLVSNAIDCQTVHRVNKYDVVLSFLPLSHVYEFTIGFVMQILNGSCIYYLGKAPTVSSLMPALSKIRPTIILSVPIIMEKIYKNKVYPEVAKNKVTAKLYKIPFFRKLIHRKAGKMLKRTFGGRIRFFGIGGAKLDVTVERFLKEGKFPYAIGYGLTETSPLVAGAGPKKTRIGTIGPVLRNVQVKILGADEKTGIGEIAVKGPNVMKGYYLEEELTRNVFTEDGWFKTGDLGNFDKKGYLAIKGRCKNMILGASGENIYPEDIEFVINQHPFVNESLVVEDGSGLVALVQIDEEKVNEAVKKKTLPETLSGIKTAVGNAMENAHLAFLYNREALLNEIKFFVNSQVNKTSKVNRVETVPEFEKTATQKIKRYVYNTEQPPETAGKGKKKKN